MKRVLEKIIMKLSLPKTNYLLMVSFTIIAVIKGILFQGFISNKNPYTIDIIKGYNTCEDYILYYLAFSMIIFSFSLLFKNKGQIIYILLADLAVTILIILDIWYYRGFNTVPSVLLANQTSNLDNMFECIRSMASIQDIVFIIDFIFFPIYLIKNKKAESRKRLILGFLSTFILPVMFVGYIPFNINVLHNKEVKRAYLFDGYDPNNTVKYFSNIGYHIIDAYTVYKNSKQYELLEQDKIEIENLFKIKNEGLPNNEYFGAAKGKNLIYIQVESLEDFVINKEINGKEITPYLNSIINKSLYFPNTYEQVNEGTSADCDFMVNTSLLPVRRGCTFFRYPNDDYNSMPKILEKNGYDTMVIHPDKGSFWNYEIALSGGIGFKRFEDYYSLNVDETIGMGISDKNYFEQVAPKLKELKKPFYGMTITLTNHGPFNLPEEYRELNLESELNQNRLGGYFESVHYTDKQIGMFIDLLDKEDILKNSIIVIMGDHAGIHKYYNDDIDNLSNKEEWYLDDGNHKVPLIIYDPNQSFKSQTFDNLINGQIDVMPTLLYLLGIPSDEYSNSCLGRNLLNTNKSFAILTNGELKSDGNLTDNEIDIYKKSLDISDKLIRSNRFYK